MKRDPQYPVTFQNGTIECGPEVRLLFQNPRGKRVAISRTGDRYVCHGLKRMPVERRRKDGAVVGQVYLYGRQWKGVVTSCDLGDFILTEIPETAGVVLPCPLDREAWNASGRPVGATLEVFAFQAGITDLGVARRVQEALIARVRDVDGVIEPSEVTPWSVPLGFIPFQAPYPVWDKAAYFSAGLDGGADWQSVLGWTGPGAAMASEELRDAVLRGREVSLVVFPEWEV